MYTTKTPALTVELAAVLVEVIRARSKADRGSVSVDGYLRSVGVDPYSVYNVSAHPSPHGGIHIHIEHFGIGEV